jgi:hypothetical protein
MSSALICAFHSDASGSLVPGYVGTVFAQVESSQHTEVYGDTMDLANVLFFFFCFNSSTRRSRC